MDSGFKHVVPEGHDTKLYQIRRVKGKTTVIQVPVRKDSWQLSVNVSDASKVPWFILVRMNQAKGMINDGDSFVLDAPDKIYVFDGPNASPFEKRQANEKAEHIETLRTGAEKSTKQHSCKSTKHHETIVLDILL